MVASKGDKEIIEVAAPDIQVVSYKIRGLTPYVSNRFSQKARQEIQDKQEAGSAGKSTRKREPKDFDALYRMSMHRFADGGYGIPAAGFKRAMVDACALAQTQKTKARMAMDIVSDGLEVEDELPLVRIAKGEPHKHIAYVRLNDIAGTIDIRARAMFDAGWEAVLRVEFDKSALTLQSITNMLVRAGLQVGIGEGRPLSKRSCGMGWGKFEVLNEG